jgi:hypothetical protein
VEQQIEVKFREDGLIDVEATAHLSYGEIADALTGGAKMPTTNGPRTLGWIIDKELSGKEEEMDRAYDIALLSRHLAKAVLALGVGDGHLARRLVELTNPYDADDNEAQEKEIEELLG